MESRRWLAALLVAAGLSLGVLGGAARAQAPLKVLLVLVGGGPHDIEKNPPFLEKALQSAGGVEVTRLAPPAGQQGSGAHLAKLAELKPGDADVVVFYTVGQSLNPQQEAALQGFVEAGGGVVAIHGASASFGGSNTWFRMIGARFAGHAPGTFTLPIAVTPGHPITQGVTDFEIVDEEYTHRFPEGVERNVVARFKQRPANTSEKGGNNDAVWTINVGKGRVVYNALGHGPEAWQHPMWQKLTVQSILWAAGKPREVKVAQ